MCHARMCSTWTCPGRHARHCAHIVRQFCALRLSVERAWSARTQSETHTSHTVQTESDSARNSVAHHISRAQSLRAPGAHILCARLTGARRLWLCSSSDAGWVPCDCWTRSRTHQDKICRKRNDGGKGKVSRTRGRKGKDGGKDSLVVY